MGGPGSGLWQRWDTRRPPGWLEAHGKPEPGDRVIGAGRRGFHPGGGGDGRDGCSVHLMGRAPLLSVRGAEAVMVHPDWPRGARLVRPKAVFRRLVTVRCRTGLKVRRTLRSERDVHDAVGALPDERGKRRAQGGRAQRQGSLRRVGRDDQRTHPERPKDHTERLGMRPKVEEGLPHTGASQAVAGGMDKANLAVREADRRRAGEGVLKPVGLRGIVDEQDGGRRALGVQFLSQLADEARDLGELIGFPEEYAKFLAVALYCDL
jgi:hypothetical protein